MKRYVYVQAGNVNQGNPVNPAEVLVAFRHVMVSAFSEEGAYVAGQKHVFTAEETGLHDDTLFLFLNDYVVMV